LIAGCKLAQQRGVGVLELPKAANDNDRRSSINSINSSSSSSNNNNNNNNNNNMGDTLTEIKLLCI